MSLEFDIANTFTSFEELEGWIANKIIAWNVKYPQNKLVYRSSLQHTVASMNDGDTFSMNSRDRKLHWQSTYRPILEFTGELSLTAKDLVG